MPRIAIVQEAPALLDRHNTLEKAVATVAQVAAEKAALVVFPEAYVSGYPAWIWRLRPGTDSRVTEELHARLLQSAVNLDADELGPLCDAARKHRIAIVCGLNERGGNEGRATLYNTVVLIGRDGNILNRHRKLMPTNPERMVWGFGDGSGLEVVDTSLGRIGTLVCWENYMPLARYALYAQGVEILVAPTYDSGELWLCTMRHIAREGRCWVISSGVVLADSDIPPDFPDRASIYPGNEKWINPGDSAVFAPGGEMVAGPMHQQKGLLYAEIDSSRAAVSKRAFDVAGHYARPDIFTLHVNTEPQNPVVFE